MKVLSKVVKQALKDKAFFKLRSRLLEKYSLDIKFGPRTIVDQEMLDYLYAPLKDKKPSLMRYWLLFFKMYMTGVPYTEYPVKTAFKLYLSGEVQPKTDSMSFY